MDFGHLDDLDGLDLSLPPDDPVTATVLRGTAVRRLHVRDGLPVWNRKDWVGPLYPPDTAPGEHLAAFSRAFETVEVNSTFYSLPSPETIDGWARAVPPSFRFCPKVSRTLSHEGGPRMDDVTRFVECVRGFGDRLGPCFLQLPPNAGLEQRRTLAWLLDALAPRVPLALELRHPAWFGPGPTRARLLAHLAERGIGMVICDTPARRDLVHMAVTAPFVLIRFRGVRLHPSDLTRAADWAARLAEWGSMGLREAYFVAHTPTSFELEGLPTLKSLIHGLEGRPGIEIRAAPEPPPARQLGLL